MQLFKSNLNSKLGLRKSTFPLVICLFSYFDISLPFPSITSKIDGFSKVISSVNPSLFSEISILKH